MSERVLKTDPANVYNRRYTAARRARGFGGRRYCPPVPCEICGAPDLRQPDHARGCPTLAPLKRRELLRLARQVEQGWEALNARKVRGASA